ncbi:hypothetical protein BDR07DRAFT_1375886 [Suillus spraguei]|nr:hypothetical protein BDR07DRAFT_1380927 [Suillus spraguei]KAG2360341.1 hypothetical protein BDR07DRAFT_1378094 [Suillus spraguei]KAG2363354.1 hypothetical protein BDR07DRAFT_1375886 [Suillus spraguei]
MGIPGIPMLMLVLAKGQAYLCLPHSHWPLLKLCHFSYNIPHGFHYGFCQTGLNSRSHHFAMWDSSRDIVGKACSIGRGGIFHGKHYHYSGPLWYILHHYPENVLMPGERRPTLARSKGIHNLTLSNTITN